MDGGTCDDEAAEWVSLTQAGLESPERRLELCPVGEGATRGILATIR